MRSGRARRPARRRLYAALAVAAGLLAGAVGCLALLEAALRLRPELFSRRFQTLAFSRYDTLPDGLYVRDPELRINFLRADHETRVGFNGYRWTHRTDSRGFRNPPGLDSPEVVLLGDSMIYGHGLEESRTAGHLLRAEHGIAAYNMARQGDGLFHHYVLARLYLEELAPRIVVAFVFINDPDDLEKARTAEELAARPEVAGLDYSSIRRRVEALQRAAPGSLASTLFRLHVTRVVRGWSRGLGGWLSEIELTAEAEAAPRRAPPTPFVEAILDPERFTPLAAYYRRTLPDLSRFCRESGARLILVNLHLDKPNRSARHHRAQGALRDLLREIADGASIPLADTGELFAGCRRCYLPHDGHLSARGQRRLAAFLAARLRAER